MFWSSADLTGNQTMKKAARRRLWFIGFWRRSGYCLACHGLLPHQPEKRSCPFRGVLLELRVDVREEVGRQFQIVLVQVVG